MAFKLCFSVLIVVLSMGCVAYGERSRNPCHPGRRVELLGATCEYIRLPPRLCRDCKLTGYDSRGYFDDCSAIYDLEDNSCRKVLEEYVELNPCDTVRGNQVKTYDDPESRAALDYFTYSICEECCDCIPRGAKQSEFRQRFLQKTLISLERGNCPAHAHYDICRVWPEVRFVTLPGLPLRTNLPKICPIIREWFSSDASKGWSSNDNTQMDPRIKRFLRIFTRFAKCSNKQSWLMCVGLESAQNRI